MYHHLKKDEGTYWHNFGRHLGTTWDRETLERMTTPGDGSPNTNSTIFVPLSLVLNPELPAILLGKPAGGDKSPGGPTEGSSTRSGDGLSTGMSLPGGEEVVNMGDLSKEEFFGLVSSAGLAGK